MIAELYSRFIPVKAPLMRNIPMPKGYSVGFEWLLWPVGKNRVASPVKEYSLIYYEVTDRLLLYLYLQTLFL